MALVVKNPPASAGEVRETSSIPGLGRSPGGGNSNPLQYSCLENPMNREAWQATVHGVAKSRTWLKQLNVSVLAGDAQIAFYQNDLMESSKIWLCRFWGDTKKV